MRSNTRLYLLALLLVAAGFLYGAAALFIARYTQGDAYAPYSSYRADPLGTKALFESLQALPKVRVARNVEPIERAVGNRQVTMFVNGFPLDYFTSRELDSDLARALDRVMQRGGRVIISFAPAADDVSHVEFLDDAFNERMQERMNRRAQENEEEQAEKEPKPDEENQKAEAEDDTSGKPREETIINLPSNKEGEEDQGTEKDNDEGDDEDARERQRHEMRELYEDRMPRPMRWEKQWGVDLRFIKGLSFDPDADTVEPLEALRSGDARLPATLPIRTTLYFEPSEDWRTVYAANGRAVLIERTVGDGSLVLVADAYLLSNEAMRTERHADLLAWLAGTNGTLLFDETTLGTKRTQGIASLMWQYRLQGVVITLIIIAALFIWKNGQPLVPPFYDALPTDAYAYVGKDSASGFTNLLKRSVPQTQVLRTCLAEWEKSFSHRSADLAESIRDAKAIILREDTIAANQRDLVQAYKDICAAFSKHRLG
ncbi:MAG: hypothetical protein IT366_06230 [Candidatus Hydrogenedentes bacterium]|nr:hypothetical protein [Candidatus Hydrogenedentota bacterium]